MFPPNLRDNMSDVTSSFFSVYAKCATAMFLIQSMNNSMKNSMNNFIPEQVRYSMYPYLKSSIKSTFLKSSVGRTIFDYLSSPNITLFFGKHSRSHEDSDFDKYDAGYNQRNQIYDAAEIYLSTKINPETRKFQISKSPQQKTASLTIAETQDIEECFENIKVQWRINVRSADNNYQCPKSRFQLTFHKNYKDEVMNSYIPHVLAWAEAMKESEKLLKIYSYDKGEHGCGHWSSVNLEHPATFETMAMEPELKRKIIDDLDRFSKRREFYKRVGKAWKRGYLLYGPPGTGKTSLAAAMANHLHFNIYDLELTSISSNIELRKALTAITNRSIVVFEDIDCSKETISRESEEHSDVTSKPSIPKFTLSGLLNFVDGLWSSCGDERIIVFTTNHKERLDPALLRPGRMDMHIEMSYCTFSGFKILASNYLEIQDTSEHRLCGEIEGLMESTNITPAEVAEELLRCDEPNDALEGLVNCLKRKRLETSKTEEEKIENTKRQKSDKMCLNFLEN